MSKAQVVYLVQGESLPREATFDDEADARLFFEILKPRVEQGSVVRARLWTAGSVGPTESLGQYSKFKVGDRVRRVGYLRNVYEVYQDKGSELYGIRLIERDGLPAGGQTYDAGGSRLVAA